MNCFVASAFDHDDVDAVYDRAIRPVLREFNVRPFRVDRVEHNDDIDDRIFQLIERSDLCIADLTYGGPDGVHPHPGARLPGGRLGGRPAAEALVYHYVKRSIKKLAAATF